MIRRQRVKIVLNPSVHVVDSKRDIPGVTKGGVVARSFVRKGGRGQRIYLVRGKATEVDRLHEEGHIVYGHYGHKDKPYITVAQYILDELNACLYSYDRVGKPRHVKLVIRGIINELVERSKLTPKGVYKEVYKSLYDLEGVPQSWKDDVVEIGKEVSRRKA